MAFIRCNREYLAVADGEKETKLKFIQISHETPSKRANLSSNIILYIQ